MTASWRRWQLTLVAAGAGLVGTAVFAPRLGPVFAVATLLLETWVRRSVPGGSAALRSAGLTRGVCSLMRGFLLALVVISTSTPPVPVLAGLVAAIVALAVAPAGWRVLDRRARGRTRDQVRWQGLRVRGTSEGPARVSAPGFLGGGPAAEYSVLVLEWPVLAGVTAVVLWPGRSGQLVLSAAAVVVLLGVLLFLGRAASFERASRRAPNDTVLPDVVDALNELSPTVVMYFSSPASGSYALRVWLETLRALEERVVVFLREFHHLEALDLAGLPVVVLPKAQDVEAAQVPSMKVVLYSTNVVKNNHMIRLPGLRHAFIGHGDSDKAGSFSPVTRVYDEIWVAGEAGLERYLAAGEGVRPEQVRMVSRPQLAGLYDPTPTQEGPATMPTVLYAPTWEGFYDQSDYCSVVSPGLEAVTAMVASGRFRVLFKPHPASGGRRRDVAGAVQEIERMLLSGPHQRLAEAPEALYEAMRVSDVLISDVSSVLSDWLACRRPYLVTNPQRLAPTELHERFPTTQGGAVLDPEGDVLGLLDEALGSDRLAPRRSQLAHHLIGPPRQDPLQDFVDEVSAFVRRSSISGAPPSAVVLSAAEQVR
jgi:xanthosine utilization system XapX-like protein